MLNEQQIRCLFDKLNKEYFFNSLPQPNRIEFKFVKKYLGQFHWDRLYSKGGTCAIRFSTAWQMTDFEIEKVLIHEMVHEWQWVVGHSDHHGYFFKHKAEEINRLSGNKYEISRLTNIENKVCLKDRKQSSKRYEGYVITYEKDSYKDKNIREKKIVAFKHINCCIPPQQEDSMSY